jgi:orotate phosphoribosyltransferase
MDSRRILALIAETGAMVTNTHVVYTSGQHGTTYLNKDTIYVHVKLVHSLCEDMAGHFGAGQVDAVLGPATGGIVLAHLTASSLQEFTPDREILALYADKTEDGGFALRRGYDKLAAGKRILVVEDVLTTGGSIRKVIEVARRAGGHVIGVSTLCNRGSVTAESLDVPELRALVNLSWQTWNRKDCPLCRRDVPINTDVGKGRQFLAQLADDD